jgi:hypothetical protein
MSLWVPAVDFGHSCRSRHDWIVHVAAHCNVPVSTTLLPVSPGGSAMPKGRHRQHRTARELKQSLEAATPADPCVECGRVDHADWCLADDPLLDDADTGS